MTNAVLKRVDRDMSEGWARDNPELAGKALTEFFREYPPEEWTLTIKRAYMPGMWLTLRADRKGEV